MPRVKVIGSEEHRQVIVVEDYPIHPVVVDPEMVETFDQIKAICKDKDITICHAKSRT